MISSDRSNFHDADAAVAAKDDDDDDGYQRASTSGRGHNSERVLGPLYLEGMWHETLETLVEQWGVGRWKEGVK